MKDFIEKLNPWITLFTNIGVLLGVLLLVMELSQNTRAIRNQTQSDNVDQWLEISQNVFTAPDGAELVIRGNEGLGNLGAAERERYFQFLTSYMMVAEAQRNTIKNNTYFYDESSNRFFVVSILSSPGARAYWALNKSYFSSDFVQYVDDVLAQADAAQSDAE